MKAWLCEGKQSFRSMTRQGGAPPEGKLTVGVVGTGNMGSALIKGWLRADRAPGLIVWDQLEAAMRAVCSDKRVRAAASLEELAGKADVVLVVVKPKDAGGLLGRLAGLVREGQIVVSAMAGLPLERLRTALGPGPEVVRIMPNLGVEAGAGAVVVAAEPGLPAVARETTLALFRELGSVEFLAEEAFDAVTAVSSSSPAFLAVAIEGLEDGAVAAGLTRAAARAVVRQAALATAAVAPGEGAASAAEPSAASSAGAPAAAVDLLEERGVRLAFRQAVAAAVARSRQMGR
jgi:pyrroline-5-carboxylate reductase